MILAVSFSGPTDRAIGSLTVTTTDRVFSLTEDHADFNEILDKLKAGENEQAEVMLDRATAIRAATVDSKFKIEGNTVTFAGRALPMVMATYIIRLKNEGFLLTPLEKFTENLFQNPSFRAINEAWRFIEANEMPITEDGCFIGYRAVTADYKDIRTRTFDNSVGSVCEEPRNLVDENPDVTCSHGLHVCSLPYINGPGAGYGRDDSPWIIVKVNPRDVVAVPRDYKNTKLRCCRFEVVGELDRSKIAPQDKKSYVEKKAVFTVPHDHKIAKKAPGQSDKALIAAGKFYELGQKHAARNDERGSGDPLTSLSFNTGTSYEQYMAGYDGRQLPTATPTVPAPTPNTQAGEARALFDAGRYADLIAFKRQRRVSLARLGFTSAEEAKVLANPLNAPAAAPAPAAVYTDSLGYAVTEPLRFDAHGYDQFGFRRSGRNRKGLNRGQYGAAPAPTVVPKATPALVAAAAKSAQYNAGYADGQAATSFLPTSTGTEYWNGFTAAWAKNPNNTNKR
jgi:hypothetical protein